MELLCYKVLKSNVNRPSINKLQVTRLLRSSRLNKISRWSRSRQWGLPLDVGLFSKRLEWFELQSEHGLIGKIDYEKTKNGTIICEDGFKATTYTAEDFKLLLKPFNIEPKLKEVDNSSLFCKIQILK